MKAYNNFFYTALRVSSEQCLRTEPVYLDEESTLITSNVMEGQQTCIASYQTFSVSAQPGEVLNISLLDFTHDQNQIGHQIYTSSKEFAIDIAGNKINVYLNISNHI